MKIFLFYVVIPRLCPSDKVDEDALNDFKDIIHILSHETIPFMNIPMETSDAYFWGYTKSSVISHMCDEVYRGCYFKKIVKKISHEEWEELNTTYQSFKITQFSIHIGKHTAKIPLPACLTYDENALDDDVEMLLMNHVSLDYTVLKQEYIDALDILGYTLYFQLIGPEAEFYSSNYSYGLTPEGAPSTQIYFRPNFEALLINKMRLILRED